jgi:homoserine dehydrogenase
VVAVEGDRVVGNLSIARRDDHPATWHVATIGMFVIASHRGRGIGTALMAEAIRWAREYGLERIELSVYPQNEGALALYRRFGFVEEGRLVRHAKKSYGYEDEIVMARWLGPEPPPRTMKRRLADEAWPTWGCREPEAEPEAERDGEHVSERILRVGLLGCGNVGAAVIRLLEEHRDDIARRAGCRLAVTKVAVRDPERDRGVPLDRSAFVTDPMAVIDDPDVDIVCELIGGVEPAGQLVLAAFDRDKPVVTANKELLATRGRELFDASEAKGLDLYFEAAVGGGIPLIRPLKESLAGERLRRVLGIVNGTTNFILTKMSEEGRAFADALAEAQRLGYAEADPTADVEGHDAAAKCAILASIAFNARVVADDVFREGISRVTAEDIEYARRLGYVVKLLAIAEMDTEERIAVRVHPAMIPAAHPLASVRDAFNAVFLEGDKVGELMFYGRGAGGDPTATAVVGDLVTVARNLLAGVRGVGCTCFHERTIRPMAEMTGQYYILLHVEDRPGVLAEIASVLAANDVSIKSVWQEGSGEDAQLVFITHRAMEGPFQRAVAQLRDLPAVEEVRSVLRVEGEE